MSRSYKKHPYVKDGGPTGVRFAKREANKKVRRTANIPNGKSYRRVSEPWDIHDYVNYWPWADAKEWYEANKDYFKERYEIFGLVEDEENGSFIKDENMKECKMIK